MQALAPAALEVSLQLTEDLELERAGLHRQWQQRLERVRYEVERARRQYDAVEPENRLVVRTLEQRWEAALADELRLKDEFERFLAEQPLPLTPDERAAIKQVACDIPVIWTAPSTTAADRQAITRLMLEQVILTVEGESEIVLVECHWAGGTRTKHDLRRPVARLTQLSDHVFLLERIRDLHAKGLKAPAITVILNTEGWCPPKRRATYTAAMVRDLLHRIGAPVAQRSQTADRMVGREANELTIDELALRLGAPRNTVHRWIQRGVVVARKLPMPTGGLWLIRVDEAEIACLRDRRQLKCIPSHQTQ
ncbi:helix-turn-helix domain-containing protein [Lichenicoccus sp.]|uniref:helix-turn-helix domain-containing protein n=1 Tax=Lichenicoccus sp. TaxID=2781899 RepID=UPI003D099734